ncbi:MULTISPECIES: D-hexose-6-phosphate mutarotase [Pantoea]|jgi:glucose-6-phosphate 1-epimerase|uniref:Putative glucose-6-phosphate 1-epimerase n=2 Tax=Pantoea TaxID=53335 RepID=A0A653SP15_9GAMM|nr:MULTISPECIES: D-hexose-6-phosphate mutarotase [Pantoea]MBS6034098.1 D-hexose-6-phosphate mutarotase [Pantoea sp.]MBZ6395110.1 D-hexose-6-phosphate mutarotase [Pantoea sp.]MBZ6438261.1 D-hexose-6-phosphate mutarotase [Pantoea sp.]MCQ5469444.1 D-hexose-6-phosphate mutarotase [Pantoea brenneri]MDH1086064.1 D-hexose-6-phosphate mutarotase [Pantoea brenneri]
MQDKLFSLPVVTQISPYLSQRQVGELPAIIVSHPKVRAALTLQGAHLIAWQPSGEQPVLWLSDKSQFAAGKAIRGGVPICWPWFGPAGEPAHGFARNQPWTLSAHDENEDGVMLTLVLESNAQTLKLWPHEFTLIARFRLGQHCEIELEAHGDFEATAALHSYFTVSDISGVEVSGLGNSYIDKVNQGEIGSSDGKQRYPGRIDRIFTAAEDCSVINDPAAQRQIEVYHHHHSDVVTWNPGVELSCSMADMPNEGYKTMVCVETARINKPLRSAGEKPARLATTFRLKKKVSGEAVKA